MVYYWNYPINLFKKKKNERKGERQVKCTYSIFNPEWEFLEVMFTRGTSCSIIVSL